MKKASKLSRQIVCLNFAPLIILALTVVMAMLFIYFKRLSILEQIRNAIYTQQKQQLLGIVAALSSQIQQQFQYASIQAIALGRFGELPLFKNIPININYQMQSINAVLLFENLGNETLDKLYQQNPQQSDQWYWKNAMYYSQLSIDQQNYYLNNSYYGCIRHAVVLDNFNNQKNLRFLDLERVRYEDGFSILNEALINNLQDPQQTPVSWLPANYCSPGTYFNFDNRCDPSVYLNLNSTVPDGLNLIPLQLDPIQNPPLIIQTLVYKQYQPVPNQPGMQQAYSQDQIFISINSIQDLLSQYQDKYNFLLFYSTTQQMAYYNSINVSDYQSIPTLQSAWLDQMQQDQQSIFLDSIPSNWNAQKYEENVTTVPNLLASLSNQLGDLQRVQVEYLIGGDIFFSIMQQIQVYAKSRTTSSIDNFFTFSVNFNKNNLLQLTIDLEDQIALQTSYLPTAGLVVLIFVLIVAFYFSQRFARSIEEPIDKLTKLLTVIDASYLQDIKPIKLQLQQQTYNPLTENDNKKEEKFEAQADQLDTQTIEKKLQTILVDLVTNKEIQVLHESLTYVYQLIKYANHEFWSGSHDLALIKMADAQNTYLKIGNITAQISCIFNIGNIHFTHSRWDEAISAYTESLTLLDKQLGEAKQLYASQLQENGKRLSRRQSRMVANSLVQFQEIKSTTNFMLQSQNQSIQSKKMDQLEKSPQQKDNVLKQKSLLLKINSLQQKKFDRYYYILLASINKGLVLQQYVLKENYATICENLVKILEQICGEMENVCYCLQFIVIYHKAIVAIYSGQLDRAAKIIQTELLNNKSSNQKIESFNRKSFNEMTKNIILDSHSCFDDQNQLQKPFLCEKNSINIIQSDRNCLSHYYHTPTDVVRQKIAYLQALLSHRQGEQFQAMEKLVLSLESSTQFDRYHFYMMEQLARNIVASQQSNFSSSDIVKNKLKVSILFDSTEYPLLLAQCIEEIQDCIQNYMLNSKSKMSIYMKSNAQKSLIDIVENQTAEWLIHHWSFMRQFIIKESYSKQRNCKKDIVGIIYKILVAQAKKESLVRKFQKTKINLIVISAQEPETKIYKLKPILKKTGCRLIFYCFKENCSQNYLSDQELSIVKSVVELQQQLEGDFDDTAKQQPILIESL